MKKGSESESSKSYNPSDAPSRVESVSNKFSRLGVINKKQPLEAFSLSVSAYAPPPPPHTHTQISHAPPSNWDNNSTTATLGRRGLESDTGAYFTGYLLDQVLVMIIRCVFVCVLSVCVCVCVRARQACEWAGGRVGRQ
jgi:hypothetical protein